MSGVFWRIVQLPFYALAWVYNRITGRNIV